MVEEVSFMKSMADDLSNKAFSGYRYQLYWRS